MNLYRFEVEIEQNNQKVVLYFNNLTLARAKAMQRAYEDNYSHIFSSGELRRFGWEEQK
jgi:hypothetical protein